MKTRILLLTAILSLMGLAFGCGGAANNTNTDKVRNTVTHTPVSTPANTMATNSTTDASKANSSTASNASTSVDKKAPNTGKMTDANKAAMVDDMGHTPDPKKAPAKK